MLDRRARLPDPQRAAIETAFALSAGNAPDRFVVGLAVLNLLRVVAEEKRLVRLVDDAQWLDQASAETLAFVSRRLPAEPIAVLFATREPVEAPLAGLPELPVGVFPTPTRVHCCSR
jgi:predicted ATPase